MNKKSWIILIIIAIIIFECINAFCVITPAVKIIKGYAIYGTEKCDANSKIHQYYEISDMLTVMVENKCEICGSKFETSGGSLKLCKSCSAITNRCSICGLK